MSTPTRQVASRRKAARSGKCGTGGHERADVADHGTARPITKGRLWILRRGRVLRRRFGAAAGRRRYRGRVAASDPTPRRPHRPAPYADLTGFIDAAGGVSPSSHAEVAAATAALVVRAGRQADDPGEDVFVALVDRVGIDTLGALWRDSDPVSLPGVLWALYLLRQWFHGDPEHVSLIWRAGAPYAPAEAAVAGVADSGDAEAVRVAADAIVAGVYRGDLAVALERAAATFRVMATGRRELAESLTAGVRESELALAERNEKAAADLTTAARRWREGKLD